MTIGFLNCEVIAVILLVTIQSQPNDVGTATSTACVSPSFLNHASSHSKSPLVMIDTSQLITTAKGELLFTFREPF
jgi:hypothetical protein